MVIYIAVVALVNLGLGFALAIYLARRHRSLTAAGTGPQPLDTMAASRPAASQTGPTPAAAGVEDLQAQVQQCNDQLTNLESRVLGAGGPSGKAPRA